MAESRTRVSSLKFISAFIVFNFLSNSSSTGMSIAEFSLHCPDSGPIKPTTPLIEFLERIQETALATFGDRDFDPKLYVDMSLKFDLGKTNRAFERLPRLGNGSVSVGDFEGFVKGYLNEAGSDLVRHDPWDFEAVPEGFLPRVARPEVRCWALEVHSLWRSLSRRVAVDSPELHTLLPLPEPVMVPGSRFREVYYWDSYWVIRGLLASKMYDTAKSIVYNLIYLMDTYGIIPNGARVYYINRSQPPLLSGMVLDVYNRTSDLALVEKALPALLEEHKFWNSGIHKVDIEDADGCKHSLNRYFAMWKEPRPETSTIDKKSASKILNDSEKQHFYRELATAAESGWDFSSRWMRNQSDITTLATTSIIPVDLNAYILKMELDIVSLARATGKKHVVEQFLEASHQREKAIKAILWNDEMGQWLDYWLSGTNSCVEGHKWKASNQNQNAFVSNFIPIWIEPFRTDEATVKKVVTNLKSSGLLCDAGIATSLSNTGQQWDFPNGWAPLQHMIVEGLAKSNCKEAKSLAEDIAVRWIKTNYATYQKTGSMHEKYDVQACGRIGRGGEYKPQRGFGWSNGVVLSFLEDFGWPRDREIDC